MPNKREKQDRGKHLKWGFIYLVMWVGVLIAEAREFEGGGLIQNVMRIKDGEIYPLFLLSLSVALLALIIRSFLHYFQSESDSDDPAP